MSQEQEAVLIDALLTAEQALQFAYSRVGRLEEYAAALAKLNRALAMMNVCADAAEGDGIGQRRLGRMRPI